MPRGVRCITASRHLTFAKRYIFCESEAMPTAVKEESLGRTDAPCRAKDDINKKNPLKASCLRRILYISGRRCSG
jgi:hypothetical protein